jgi:cytochrome bd ubiquinol oxidase subunit II
MVEIWFAIAALTVTAYVVLDGFDLGSGALHLLVARTDTERRQVLAAIGPYWDGNEVWLLATGGVLFVAFPKVLASSLSGFYMAIMLVIWTLMLRGLAIEFRSHVRDPLWRSAWDALFSVASALLCVFLGAALGNLMRGLPLDADGWFSLSLFTDWSARPPVGILDWYTVLVGLFALLSIAGHGGAWLAWKAGGPVGDRARSLARRLWIAVAALWLPITLATAAVNPGFLSALASRPLAWIGAALALAGMAAVFTGLRRRPDGAQAFIGSCAFLGGLLVATAAATFPVMLRATGDPSLSLTAHATATDRHGLAVALRWWIVAFPLAVGYLVLLFRLHKGKAVAAPEGEGY